MLRRLGLALSLASGPAAAASLADSPQLLQCDVIVTGMDGRSRPEAVDRCVRDVAVRVTGRPDLADDPRLATMVAQAPKLIEDFYYLDRMTDVPTHDEQGTRDRPYDFVGHVDPAALDAALAAAGLRAWLDRPIIVALVTVTPRVGDTFPLTGDGLDGERQREAIMDASRRYGIRVVLPTVAQAQRMDRLKPGDLHADTRGVVLTGSLLWSGADYGWNARWELRAGDAPPTWEVRGVSFDAAFRSAVGGVAQALASRP